MYESEMSWWWDVAILATSNWPQHQQFLKPTHPLPIQRVWWKLKEDVSIETPFSCEARPNRATLEGWDLITSNATCKKKTNANSRQRRCLCQGPRSISPSEHGLRFTAPNVMRTQKRSQGPFRTPVWHMFRDTVRIRLIIKVEIWRDTDADLEAPGSILLGPYRSS